ncbi:hypothetical protein HDV00_002112 [Rhizophlyctis rosea]|nr:hypothetical protein HDV00_002112 [Rhizophlyctis rosea]
MFAFTLLPTSLLVLLLLLPPPTRSVPAHAGRGVTFVKVATTSATPIPTPTPVPLSSPPPSPTTEPAPASWTETTFSGRVTYYGDGYKTIQNGADPPPIGPDNGGWYGACYDALPGQIVIPKNFNKFAALNTAQYTSLSPTLVCGQCLTLSYPPLNTTTTVQIVDQCPGCQGLYGVDISHTAFAELVGGWDEAFWIGVLSDVRWWVVGCEGVEVDGVFEVGGLDGDWVIGTGVIAE